MALPRGTASRPPRAGLRRGCAVIWPKDRPIPLRCFARLMEPRASGGRDCRSDWAMKLSIGWVMPAAVVLGAAAVNAQGLPPQLLPGYEDGGSRYTVSDFESPYVGMQGEYLVP